MVGSNREQYEMGESVNKDVDNQALWTLKTRMIDPK